MFGVFFDKKASSPNQRKVANAYMPEKKHIFMSNNAGAHKGSPRTNCGSYSPINVPKCLTPSHQSNKIALTTKSTQGLFIRGESLGKENIGFSRTPDSKESQIMHERKDSSCAGFSSISEITEEGKGAIHFIPQSKPCNTSKKGSGGLVSQSLSRERTDGLYKKDKFLAHQTLLKNFFDNGGFQYDFNNTGEEFINLAKLNNVDLMREGFVSKKKNFKQAINFKDKNGWTAMHYAAFNGNQVMVHLLFYHEAILDIENDLKQTPMIVASQRGHTDIVTSFYTYGADINHSDIYDNSPLHYASQGGFEKLVEYLLTKKSIDVSKRNYKSMTAYDAAKTSQIRSLFERKKQNDERQSSHNNVIKIERLSYDPLTSQDKEPGSIKLQDKIGPQNFNILGMIGKGSFGEVYLVEKHNSQKLYAMKVLEKSKITKNNLIKYAMTERNVLSVSDHPFIIKLSYAFQTPEKLFLILDFCPGGDLSEHLQKEKKFDEERVKIYLAEIILALENLHERDIIFRDLKPDNIVLDIEGHAMLTDFGLSKEGVIDHDQGAQSFCGSVAYLAPEMLKRCGHGKAVDWYLLGVVMYELLVGVPPYYATNREELFSNIQRAPLKMPSYISNEAKSLLKGLLQRNPAKRLGSGKGDAEEIKMHPFFKGISWEDVYKRKLKPPIPQRKLRICTKIDPNIFSSSRNPEEDKVPGWSFVSPVQTVENN